MAGSIDGGQFQLARARYMRGSVNVGSMNWPEDMKATLTVDVVQADKSGTPTKFNVSNQLSDKESQPTGAEPTVDGLKQRKRSETEGNKDGRAEGAAAESASGSEIVNPLRW